MSQVIKITLKQTEAYPNDPPFTAYIVYVVKELKNSIEFKIGETLDSETVKSLCRSPRYDVTIR